MAEFKRLSKITVGWGAYIVVSAAFMLQVRSWLFRVLGDFVVINCFRLCFVLIFIFTVIYAFRMRLSLFRVWAILFIFILGYLLVLWQPYFSEKAHVLTYGLLGYLTSKDLLDTKRKLQFKNIALALCFVSLVSALDEIFQGILPYRVGEIRDFTTNIMSSTLGIGLWFIFS